jgi:3D-(3,5/4)-trihydroxycyclohexane-1,2-dione acylhydrolase (decyclizing)
MSKTIRLTVGQALLQFVANQYVERDGKENRFIEGIWGIFGHGNPAGLGSARRVSVPRQPSRTR